MKPIQLQNFEDQYKAQKNFENQCKELIPYASIEEIIYVFENKRKNYKGSKLSLLFKKIKDKITSTKYAQFLQLGYNIEYANALNFMNDIFDLSIKHNREDVMEYMFKSYFLQPLGSSVYLYDIVASEKILKHILSIEEISKKLTSYDYSQMLCRCSFYSVPESFDIICRHDPQKIKDIKILDKTEILLATAKYNCQTMLEKLLKLKEPLIFDIENSYQDNLLIIAAQNNNKNMIKYLLSSPELEKHADLGYSYLRIEELPNGQEIIEYIALNVPLKITQKLEQVLKDNVLLKVFKNKDMFLNLSEKYPEKQQKTKVKKI